MRYLPTKENQNKIDAFFGDIKLRKMVEQECGRPVKVRVIWDKGIILVQGPFSGRELQISDILGTPQGVMIQ